MTPLTLRDRHHVILGPKSGYVLALHPKPVQWLAGDKRDLVKLFMAIGHVFANTPKHVGRLSDINDFAKPVEKINSAGLEGAVYLIKPDWLEIDRRENVHHGAIHFDDFRQDFETVPVTCALRSAGLLDAAVAWPHISKSSNSIEEDTAVPHMFCPRQAADSRLRAPTLTVGCEPNRLNCTVA